MTVLINFDYLTRGRLSEWEYSAIKNLNNLKTQLKHQRVNPIKHHKPQEISFLEVVHGAALMLSHCIMYLLYYAPWTIDCDNH